MEYVDGGWSVYTFAKSLNNLSKQAAKRLSPSKAFAFSSAGLGLKFAWGYWTTTTIIGAKVASAVAYVGSLLAGPIGIALGVAAALGVGALCCYMGNGVRFA